MDTFEQLYMEYYPRLYAFLFNMCQDHHLAEELTQDSFYQAFTSLHRFRGKSEVFTWLASIAKHTYFKHLRKHKHLNDHISIELITDVFCQNNLNNPEEVVQRQAVAEGIRKILRTIPDKYRDVVLLRVYAGLPFAQVAAALNISENSAKVIFFRAKKMLMEELKHEFDL